MKLISSFKRGLKMISGISYHCKSDWWGHRPQRYAAARVPTNGLMEKESFIFQQLLTVTFFFLSIIASGFSCKRNNSQVAENVVYYYPEKNIYYDTQQSNYYYSLDGARSWDSMTFKGPGYGTVLGPKVPIKKTGNNIWVNNESHRKEYNGVLLNIVNNQTILISKADSINKLRTIVPVSYTHLTL